MPDRTASPAEARVIGVVGDIPDALRRRIIDERPEWVVHDLDSPRLLFLTRGRTHTWTTPESRGIHWSGQGEAGPVTSWQQTMHDTLAPGVAVSPDRIVLHASAWGFEMLYVAWLGPTALAFSTTSSALVDLLDGQLDPDWDAWACILTFNNPINGRTPFEQIRRLRGGERHELDVRSGTFSTHRDLPRVAGEDRAVAEPGEIVDAIRGALKAHPALGDGPADSGYLSSLPLTGGWDSRLLASVAVDVFGPDAFLALTTSKHTDNIDPDVTFGTRLAQHLGMTQEIIHPDGRANPLYARNAFTAVEFETSEHTWHQPAATVLVDRALPIIDGFAGDILMKNAVGNLQLFLAETDIGEHLWRTLNRQPAVDTPGASATVLDALSQRARPHVEASRAGLEGARNESRLVMLRTRIVSGIALSPFKLLARGAELVTPIIHPAVMSALLSVPAADKTDSALARRVLEAARPGVSSLPSTNDHIPRTARGRRRTNTPEARAWTTERLGKLDEYISYGFTAEDVETLHSKRADSWRQRLMMLTCWLEAYEPRLTSTRPPWWDR